MLDLDNIFNTSEQILPSTGIWGYLLENWLVIAIVVMLLGFLLDQVLYIVRYRPQDKWKQRYYGLRHFLTEKFGAKPVEEHWPEEPNPLMDTGVTVKKEDDHIYTSVKEDRDVPLIRRGGAIYAPQDQQAEEFDEDAPNVVRPAAGSPIRSNEEPTTYRANKKAE